ncbi:MAG: PEP/pyruvate-binding domain-containing protein [bacterium]
MVGWKFFNLHILWKNKIPVPPFFCLTRSFYEEAMKNLSGLIHKRLQMIDFSQFKSIQDAAEDIKRLIAAGEFTQAQKREILSCFDQHFSPDTLVSVRSSGIGNRLEAGEDSQDNPFAGMSDSFLFVRREQIFHQILLCWASGYTARSILYRHQQNLPLSGFGLAVGIQKMISGERSFVLFTVNPHNISRDSVIVAGYGIGEGIVQETVAADHYFMNARTGEIHAEIREKAHRLVFDERQGWGLKKESVPPEKRAVPCLNEAEIASLVRTGRTIESIFKTPQDIEGTITGEGECYFIQSRPIAIDYTRCRLWSSANVSESFPGLTTPLTYSFARTFYQLLNYDYLRRCGVKERDLHTVADTLNSLIGFIDGRIYHAVSSFYDMLALSPLFDNYRQDWERLVAELDSYYHSPDHRFNHSPNHRKKKIGFGVYAWSRAVMNSLTLDSQFIRFQKWWDNLMLSRRGTKYHSQHPLALASDYRHVWREAGNWWGITLINYQYMVFFHKMIEKYAKKWGIDQSLLNNLLCGDSQFMGVEIVLSVVRLSDMVKSDPVLLKVFQEKDAGDIWNYIEEQKIDPDFIKEVKLHLYQYGDRGFQELKLEQPNLRDIPWELIRMIQKYVHSDLTAQSLVQAEHTSRLLGEEGLKKALSGYPLRLWFMRFLLKRLRRFLYYREKGRYMRSELFGYSKNIFQAIGSDLYHRGIIAEAKDIFYLTKNEIFDYLEGTGVSYNLAAVIRMRKQEYEEFQKSMPEKEFTTSDIVALSIPQEKERAKNDLKVFRGLGSSSGKVSGYARIILDPDLRHRVTKEDIIIARETDPGWLFLMLSARGMVVERGSMLSHTAITGRKFGIPTIVALPHATQRIPEGSYIEIDGSTGIVKILGNT